MNFRSLPSPMPSPRPLRSSKTVNLDPQSSPSPPTVRPVVFENDEDDPTHCAKLTSRDFLLEVQFEELRQKIIPLFNILGKTVPCSPLEHALLTRHDPASKECFQVTADAVTEAENLLKSLSEDVDEKGKSAATLWSEVGEMWSEMCNKEDRQLTFSNAHVGVIEGLKFLKMQCIRRQGEKQERITQYILDLRNELSEIWNQCLITEEEKQQFSGFHSSAFSEDLLDKHKEELRKWKIYHEKNQAVLDRMKQRQEMWKKLRELEARSNDPARFVNRGGALLKDQKDHATIMKQLPKLENELKNLALQFEVDHGRKVTVFGQDVCTIIDREWKEFNDQKQNKKLLCRVKVRQSMMPPPAQKVGEKRPAPKPLATPTPKRKCQN